MKVGGVAGATVTVTRVVADVWVVLRVTLTGLIVDCTGENVVAVRDIVPENPAREDSVRVVFAVWPASKLRK